MLGRTIYHRVTSGIYTHRCIWSGISELADVILKSAVSVLESLNLTLLSPHKIILIIVIK